MSVCIQGISNLCLHIVVYLFLHLHILLEADANLADAQ